MNLTELDFYVEIIYTYKTTSAFNDIQTTSYTQNTSILNDLELKLGPRFKPQVFIILMSIVYLILFLCGLIGNLCSCLVITLNECMRTTINYYLFSLAISDVLSLLLGLLPELYSIIFGAYPWPFGRVFCILRTFAFETTTIASVLIILAFTFERWLRICKPFFAKTVSSSLKRALKIILSIWSTSFILALPFTYLTNTEYLIQDEPQSELCKPIDKYADYMYNLLLLSSIFLFILPMGLIITMYAMIGLTLWKSQSNNNPCSRVNSLKSTNSSYNHQLNKNQLNIKTDLSANKLSAAASSVSLSNFLQSKTRQTRRDVIKMLCKLVLFDLTINLIFLVFFFSLNKTKNKLSLLFVSFYVGLHIIYKEL